jgi:hypothetical protein
VALVNAVCRDYYDLLARARGQPQRAEAEPVLLVQERHARARIRAILTPAASHPRVGTLVKDLAAREKVRSRLESPGLTQARREDFYRANVRVYDDEKALGMTACTKHPPLASNGG